MYILSQFSNKTKTFLGGWLHPSFVFCSIVLRCTPWKRAYCWNLLHSHLHWHEVLRAAITPEAFKGYFQGTAAPNTPAGMPSVGTNPPRALFSEDASVWCNTAWTPSLKQGICCHRCANALWECDPDLLLKPPSFSSLLTSLWLGLAFPVFSVEYTCKGTRERTFL